MEEKVEKIVEIVKSQIREKMIQESEEKKEMRWAGRQHFYTSDMHFGDERLNLYGRDLMFKNSKEVDEYIVETWNKTVGKDDVVVIVGDVSMTREGLETLNRLNGEKILVKGNYDNPIEKGGTAKYEISDEILLKYFVKVVDELRVNINGETVYINHYPTKTKKKYFNIVGHIHGLWKVQRNMVNVGCDAWHFTPVSEDLIKFQMNGIRVHYDQNVYAGELMANIVHRKGEIKILRAPTYDDVATFEESEDIVVFMAGPIQGTNSKKMWQEEFVENIQKELKDVKTNKNIIFCSPRRLEKPDKDKFVYEEQVEWESYYLEKSAKQGIIVFWLAKEEEKIEGRSFAQTTRWELSEWWTKSLQENIKIIVGADKEFEGQRYITYKFKQKNPNFEIINNRKEMVDEITKQIKKMI